jgi:hypothetical protein
MTTPPSTFKTLASVALVAIALAIVAFDVMPAQAQSAPASNFNLDIPGGQSGLTLGLSAGDTDQPAHANEDNAGTRCLTNREVRRGVENKGYERVEITDELPQERVAVHGTRGNWLYAMDVDKCTGAVERVERVRRVQGGGFGLQFNFGD